MFEALSTKHFPPKLPYAPIPGDWYDADYLSGAKSNWTTPYRWEYFKQIFVQWAKIVIYGFPESKSFLDIGCATGMLERAMIELSKKKHLRYHLHGFDHSPAMIDAAEELSRPFIECTGVDEFVFTRNYDVMISLDVFEHLTEEQARNFLTRSRQFINDSMFFVIALDEPHQRLEPSHINLHDREWWHDMITSCGWVQDTERKLMQDVAMSDNDIQKLRVQIFIYGARENV